MAKKSNDFWLGRFAVEAAVALTFLESGNVDLAREGLSETIDAFTQEHPDHEIIEYLKEVRQERNALTPVSIPYRGDSSTASEVQSITGQEIASRL